MRHRVRYRRAIFIIFLLAACLLFMLQANLRPPSPLTFGVTTVTNEFGFPVAQVNFANRSDASIYLMLETEALSDRWSKVGSLRTLLIAPHSTAKETFDHPIPEGKWRIALNWSRSPPRGSLYWFLRQHWPSIGRYFEQEHHDTTAAIEAWQPPEIRH
jgi:hypothetical protein